ncbi:hypothetical protein TNCV_2239591 [Trichonephila clavipes]|nr:hypothetical protein TNCV_2239591 [Trichonephila clavipes]
MTCFEPESVLIFKKGSLFDEICTSSDAERQREKERQSEKSKCFTTEGILKSHSLSSLLNFLRAFGDGPVAGVSGGQGIESWLACLEFEPSATKDPPCRAAMHVISIES